MLAGVSTRRYRRTQEPVGQDLEQQARSTSKSSVSRTFVERTRVALQELMSRRLDDVCLAVIMIDGIELQGRCCVVALGITTEGVKIPLGLWEESTENAAVATALLSDLVERGLDPEQGIRLGVSGNLKRTLQSANPCESMLEIVRRTQRNVKRWSSGEMALRWTAAGMLEAERQFRRIIGYRDLAHPRHRD
jgi:putative transposase